MDIRFDGKRVLVTGAGQGIGRGITVKLAECGATVVAVDIIKDTLDRLKAEIPSIEPMLVDLSNWKETADAIRTAFPIDLLVNNAAIGFIEPLTTTTEEQYDKMFDVNVKAVVNVSKTVVEGLLQRQAPGAVVTISSQASKAALLHHTLYCAAKGAVDAFTRAAALEFGPNSIRFNCINPTVVMTDLGRRIWSDPAMKEPMIAKIPLQRFAEVEDVVNAVVFLLSDKASMITGTCLPVDELKYLADHLLPEECRRLVAAAHFKSYLEPNALGQAERIMPKDIPCLQLLLHWNSAEGEGRGETHEVLQHRLRQMGKDQLADWLGKTVFRQLGKDLEETLREGLQEIVNETSTVRNNISLPTIQPLVIVNDPTEWQPFDTICLTLLMVLFLTILGLCCFLICRRLCEYCRARKKRRHADKSLYYEMMEANSSDSEDRFDIREYETAM